MSSAPVQGPAVARTNVAEIQQFAAEVFEDEAIADRWLHEPNIATDNKSPIELVASEEGFSHVKMLLQRIEYGVLA